LYSTDLAYVHDAGFDDVAAHAAPEIARTLRAAGIRDGHVVEVGCGSGTVARHLLSRGYQVTGLDISPAMIRLGRAKAPDARFRVASLTTARIPPCDAVVALGEVITYVPGGIAAIQRFFHRVFTALAPGGLLLFDFIASAAHRTYSAKCREGRDWAIASTATYDRSRRILTRRMVIIRQIGVRHRRRDETHEVRIYSRREIRGALERAGFSVGMSRRYGRYRLLPGDVAVVANKCT
jgi:SAM-dependent methyltransferase